MIRAWLRVAWQGQVPPVGGRQMHVDHLYRGKLSRMARGVSPGAQGFAKFFSVTCKQ